LKQGGTHEVVTKKQVYNTKPTVAFKEAVKNVKKYGVGLKKASK